MKTKTRAMMNKYAFRTTYLALLVLAGAALFLSYERNDLSSPSQAINTSITADENLQTLEVLKSEIERLKDARGALQNSYSQMEDELVQLRSQLAEQKVPGTSLPGKTDTGSSGNPAKEPESEESPVYAQEGPHAADERAAVQIIAQVDLLEDRFIAEETDPDWSSRAEDTLIETYEGDQAHGLFVADLDCRTTLCRMELTLDGSISPEESFRNLSLLAPWPGDGFVRISGIEGGNESPLAVVYLARDGYVLPQHVPE